MKSLIKQILLEEVKKTQWEYQVRDIGGSEVYYKKKKGNKYWSFTDEKDFNINSKKGKIIKWDKKKGQICLTLFHSWYVNFITG